MCAVGLTREECMRHCLGTCEYLVGTYYMQGITGRYLYACKKNQQNKNAVRCVSSGQRELEDGNI